MATPRHRTAPGTSYFVTTKCWQGRTVFQLAEAAEILRSTLFHHRDRGAYSLHEFVIMPDHLHLLLTPGSATSLEKAVQLIKGGSSHRIHKERNQKMEIWQEGFYDWTLRDADDWRTKVEYIHMNPVRAKLVQRPQDWPYSSANRNFTLDQIPAKYMNLTSGAKAPITSPLAPGLKPRPPEEQHRIGGIAPAPSEEVLPRLRVTQGLKPTVAVPLNVGAKAPTPKGAGTQTTSPLTPGLKPRPPKEYPVPPKGQNA